MLFNFFLANHLTGGLRGMPDLVQPIYHGLADAGHDVVGFGLGMQSAPAVNVFLEFFPDDAFVEGLLKLKIQLGDKFIFGVICTEDVEDKLVMEQPEHPRRRPNLERVLAVADFVWTLLPQVEAYERMTGAGKVALLRYGFTERFLNDRILRDPALRDLDVLMYGNPTPYRTTVVDDLRRRGFNCFVSDRQVLPDFITNDVVSRSKLVLDLRRGTGVRFPSPTRICKAVHAGARVVSEHLGDSPIANLYDYTAHAPYTQLADRCEALLRGGRYVEEGLEALQRFRTETSMRQNILDALALPIFKRLAQG
jgi:hypothetical protein